jgi:MFS family permease
MSIFPYIYYMIQSFHISSDEDKIAAYAGMVTSAFAFAEFSCAVLWGRLSDVIGRKPVLLVGLFGTGLSMILFGFSRSFPMLLISRALGGMLNGNIGVIQTTVAEVIRGKEEHQARAYSIVPFVWTVGGILGSTLGGLLAMPVQNYPTVFAKGTIWDKYPFLLPNVVCTFVVVVGLVVGILFLEETHELHMKRRDYGLELGEWLTSVLFCRPRPRKEDKSSSNSNGTSDEQTPLLADSNTSPANMPSADVSSDPEEASKPTSKPSFTSAFTPQVLLQILAYGFLAYHTAVFGQLFPILLSMEPSSKPTHLPFRFTGGFGLPSKTIGLIYAVQGVYNMFVQVVVFPAAVGWLGTHRLYKLILFSYGVLYLLTPYSVLLQGSMAYVGITIVTVLHVTYGSMAYPSNALLLANSAPSLMVLGSINGVAASMAALCRAAGPTLSGYIQGWGLKMGVMGLGWWSGAIIAALGAIEAIWLRDPDVFNKDRDGRGEGEARRAVNEQGTQGGENESESAGIDVGGTLVEQEERGLAAEAARRRSR